jgi:hypothetical protein
MCVSDQEVSMEFPDVSASALLGAVVTEAMDAGARNGSIYLHGVPDDLRERICARMVYAGWNLRDDRLPYDGVRAVFDRESGTYLAMWT